MKSTEWRVFWSVTDAGENRKKKQYVATRISYLKTWPPCKKRKTKKYIANQIGEKTFPIFSPFKFSSKVCYFIIKSPFAVTLKHNNFSYSISVHNVFGWKRKRFQKYHCIFSFGKHCIYFYTNVSYEWNLFKNSLFL